MGKRRARIQGEPELFDTRSVKGKIVERMAHSYFRSLLKKGWDPGFFVDVQADDYPTLGTRYIGGFGHKLDVDVDPAAKGDPIDTNIVQTVFLERRRCVVLSKGPEDTNRRIIAQDTDGWVVGLWISMLRRQLKKGNINVQAWCFSVLIDLENIESFFHTQHEEWIKTLIQKEQP